MKKYIKIKYVKSPLHNSELKWKVRGREGLRDMLCLSLDYSVYMTLNCSGWELAMDQSALGRLDSVSFYSIYHKCCSVLILLMDSKVIPMGKFFLYLF